MLVFSYGSNLLTRRLRRRVPSAHPVGVAVLEGFELRHHKRGRDGSGKADAFRTGCAADRVVGVLSWIRRSERRLLDRAEGVGDGYDAVVEEVRPPGGETRKALLYVATELQPGLRPFAWYKRFVLHGALEHRLPPRYVGAIAAWRARPDPDRRRAAANLGILLGSGPSLGHPPRPGG